MATTSLPVDAIAHGSVIESRKRTNPLLHVLAGLLVWWSSVPGPDREWKSRRLICVDDCLGNGRGLAAAPLQASIVLYLVQRMTVLVTLLAEAGLICYVH